MFPPTKTFPRKEDTAYQGLKTALLGVSAAVTEINQHTVNRLLALEIIEFPVNLVTTLLKNQQIEPK